MENDQAIEALNRLESKHPRLKAAADRLREEWAPEYPPLTVLAAAIAREFSQTWRDFNEHELRSLFAVVEEVLSHDDSASQDLIATGFLESLQAAASAGTFDFSVISKFLGEKSKQYCQAWDTFTGSKTPGL